LLHEFDRLTNYIKTQVASLVFRKLSASGEMCSFLLEAYYWRQGVSDHFVQEQGCGYVQFRVIVHVSLIWARVAFGDRVSVTLAFGGVEERLD
jgi:hypothetical protein